MAQSENLRKPRNHAKAYVIAAHNTVDACASVQSDGVFRERCLSANLYSGFFKVMEALYDGS
jgi:hypothetical protein